MKKVVLESYWDDKNYLDLTDDQFRLLKWLYDEGLIHEDYTYTEIDNTPEFKRI